ncbi:hypothetical protein GF366_00945 [Candidatus Peregrinibacteria bacterium]|nr:hypothetical protein [Candidatus Peregrinibacteria bacterium]
MDDFQIREEDRDFLKKISPTIGGRFFKIPDPKLSPRERERRRLAFRNERNLYRRKSSLSNENIISFFDKDVKFKVYSHEEWWSDKWDPLDFGAEYDFSGSFFEQFYELQLKVPRPPLINNKAENSPYCNFADGNKNCHMITSSNWNEDCYYGYLMVGNKDCMDCLWCSNSELLYECIDCRNCYNLKYSRNCENCSDGAFLLNCKGVKNCLMCVNLNNKEYYFLNKKVTSEEFEKLKKILDGSYRSYKKAQEKSQKFKKENPVRKSNNYASSENVLGDNIFNSRNIYFGFDVYDSEDCAYCHDGLKGRDCFDVCFFDGTELCYESTSLIGYGFRFTMFCRDSSELFYCDNCHSCKDCFACVGLRNKQYCILNKQYSWEEYEELVVRIIKHMSETGEWGEFFPIENSLFAYNETLADDYFPMEKVEVLSCGWKWKDREEKGFVESDYKIPDDIKDVDESICDEILSCEVSGENYKIIPEELKFYKRLKVPIPRLSPNQRNKERLMKRNPRKLWERNCDKCGERILTTYSPERSEKVYCEKCYLEDVYQKV